MFFVPKKPCKRGHSLRYIQSKKCVECMRVARSVWQKEHLEGARIIAQRWRDNNPQRAKEVHARYRAIDPARARAKIVGYRTKKSEAMPKWLTEEDRLKILEVYAEAARLTIETGILHHVDHIIPLQGEIVSGLHVPWNLQAIPAKDNLSKSNKLELH